MSACVLAGLQTGLLCTKVLKNNKKQRLKAYSSCSGGTCPEK